MDRHYLTHLTSAEELRTTYAAVRAGFVSLALERNRRATPHIAQARSLKVAASRAATAHDLVGLPEIQGALLTAAGVSDKAAGHFDSNNKAKAIAGLIENHLEPAGENFVEELVFRFLLTRGDTLGGTMRNIGGFLAQQKLTASIVGAIQNAGRACRWFHTATKRWADLEGEEADTGWSPGGLFWESDRGPRTLFFNAQVPVVNKNVDLVLVDCPAGVRRADGLADLTKYIALGELKGGIDPAGADEHWKTARSALNRIHTAFTGAGLKPHSFFVGAAIEEWMAREIWDMLVQGTLESAANLTNDDQLASLTTWLYSL